MFALPILFLLTPPTDLADWTPRPAVGQAEPWEKKRDPQWDDDRFLKSDTGPFFNCTFRHAHDKGQVLAYQATAVRVGEHGEAAIAFDRHTLRIAAGWTGGFLTHSPRRFALLNTPTPAGELVFSSPAWSAWGDLGEKSAPGFRHTAPVPNEIGHYRGLYLHGPRVTFAYTAGKSDILEQPWAETLDKLTAITLTVEAGPTARGLTRRILATPKQIESRRTPGKERAYWILPQGNAWLCVGVVGEAELGFSPEALLLRFEPSELMRRGKVLLAKVPAGDDAAFAELLDASPAPTKLGKSIVAGPARWGEPILTELKHGKDDGAFATDTLTIPTENPYKALFFCTGVDFLPDGRVAVCTAHGDVWLVTLREGRCAWKRYATGLYHALGLKVVDGKIVVLERGQLTRLHDNNNDGEADFYENVNHDWHTGGGEHSYDTCLETDSAGNFYFFKTGDTETPTGGCLMKVSSDGAKAEIFATGFRHPIGLGMSPDRILTGADQEGNWMPATRIDEYKQGGFYGDMRAHHRKVAPAIYDGPLCWLPREVDNSAGGQVWVPEGAWGELGGLPLHFSYGRCKAFVLLRQRIGDVAQGGAADLGLHFLSGSCRVRFGPDGNLYVCGLNGWQTAAQADGSLQRVRRTDAPLSAPVRLEYLAVGVKLTFAQPLDVATASNPKNYNASRWNYRWSGDYGSKRWKLSDPKAEGEDRLPVTGVDVARDGRSVLVQFADMQPAMQMHVGYHLRTTTGTPMVGSVYGTIHRLP